MVHRAQREMKPPAKLVVGKFGKRSRERREESLRPRLPVFFEDLLRELFWFTVDTAHNGAELWRMLCAELQHRQKTRFQDLVERNTFGPRCSLAVLVQSLSALIDGSHTP